MTPLSVGAGLLAALTACAPEPTDASANAKPAAATAPAVAAAATTPATAAPAPAVAAAAPADGAAPAAGPVIDFPVETLDGRKIALSDYRGKAMLIVNTASECGFTPQYAGLQQLYGRYKDKGLVVLGFPSNDYGGQEPGDAEQIASFVSDEYAVDFPMMAKLATKGPDKAPVYAALTEQTPEGIRGEVKWNFTKFLVDPDGKVVGRFESAVDPLAPELIAAVEQALPKP